jgi:class 3 adenylate cyclase
VNEIPETKYVAVGEADVAYQVLGDGPFDLLFFSGLGQIDLQWSYPPWATQLARLATFSRLVLFDRRGTGASDGVLHAAPTWEDWTDDMAAVLDAAGSERAAIVAFIDGGPTAVLFAAMRPERVSALVLGNTTARFMVDDDYPVGMSPEFVDAGMKMIRRTWGTPDFVRAFAGANDPEEVRWLTMYFRAAATPRTAAAQYRYMIERLDVRRALPLLQAPTLVLHNSGNSIVPVEHGRYLADQVAGAKFVELPGQGVGMTSQNAALIIDEIEEFLTGVRPAVEVDRILTTVLFTDIVGSTQRAVSLGDKRWRALLDAHDRAVRDQLRRFRGREIKTTGDGFLASFDGPARAIRCARAISEAGRELGIELRAGLHTGECEVRGDDLGGVAVHIAARVGAVAGPGQVFVSTMVKDLVAGSGIEFADRGEHQLKGLPGSWRLFSVED